MTGTSTNISLSESENIKYLKTNVIQIKQFYSRVIGLYSNFRKCRNKSEYTLWSLGGGMLIHAFSAGVSFRPSMQPQEVLFFGGGEWLSSSNFASNIFCI